MFIHNSTANPSSSATSSDYHYRYPRWEVLSPRRVSALPCLYSNISISATHEIDGETHQNQPSQSNFSTVNKNTFLSKGNNKLSTQHKKSATILTMSVSQLAAKYGLARLGFLTLTFADKVLDARLAWKRFNSLATNVLRDRYLDYICVMERMKSGRVHFHLVVALCEDIRTGFNFAEVSSGVYQSANRYLKSEWSFWRKTAKNYHFGRTELLPIKSNSDGIAKYVGKYISKAIEARLPEDKGINLVSYSNGARAGNTRFAFVSDNSARWRAGVEQFSHFVASRHGIETCRYEDLQRYEGKRWAYTWRDLIIALGTNASVNV